MNVLVVDDEPLARDRLIRFLQDFDFVTGTQAAANGVEALARLDSFSADVVLLDIRMPGMSGLEVAEQIAQREEPPAVVFCTAYDDHALDAFKVKAQAYLLKPVQREALSDALAGCTQLNRAQRRNLGNDDSVATISVHNGREKERLPMSEVFYFRADQKYVSLYCSRGERIVDESLKTLEEKFADCLVRIHRNTLVYGPRIERLNREPDGTYAVYLKGVEEALAVSRRHAKEVKGLFKDLG